jgi:S1-C subfamily serine protease
MRQLVAVVMAAVVWMPTIGATDWEAVAKKANESVVFVQAKGTKCTGFVINSAAKGDKDYIQSAAHCAGEEIFADSMLARIIFKDTQHDLMVLEVDDTERPALRLAATNPKTGQEIASLGFGYALARPMFRTAHVSDDAAEMPDIEGGPFIMIDAAYVGGQSGGPCVNLAGEVVSIVQMGNTVMGLGVGAERIRKRAGRYYEKP